MSTHTLTRTVSPTYRACENRSVDSLLWHIYISVCCLLGPKPKALTGVKWIKPTSIWDFSAVGIFYLFESKPYQ